ncbi:hypothetical protein I3843_07G155400 [Carya illinoinensis]|uniref:B-like cyclin n=1 Tax=Carya illinoinensis TaxID=32201 RepID=A0A922JI10_CARIL|nr:hypothetical protein I3760_07G155900 [Carya illinoinensis]KAG6705009.1 hypothetical protein I3842_07G160600 [Carya illinoinensis]KAG7971841.1 hypothetical protein I3843_07G155400 [Carya illinoinensis]
MPQQGISRAAGSMCLPEEPHCDIRKWYFSRKEIEDHSPSRKDGIDLEYESHLRESYCKFIQRLGEKLKVPQVKIASGMLLCHRFYMRQSHAKNDWQTIATASTFLACKIGDTPRFLKDVVLLSYEMMYEWDRLAPQRIRKEHKLYDKQRELILIGERLLLSTIAFDLDIQLPYQPLVAGLKKLDLSNLAKVAWNFVNDTLRTTLCLQYKPHYIAAGSIFLAATALESMELLTKKKNFWWLEFEISPKQLKEVIQHMMLTLKQNIKQVPPATRGRITQSVAPVQKAMVNGQNPGGGSAADCSSSCSNLVEAGGVRSNKSQNLERGDCHLSVKEALPSKTNDNGCDGGTVEDHSQVKPKTVESDQRSSYQIFPNQNNHIKIDTNRIREALKRKRRGTAADMKFAEATNSEMDSEAWIERELENGIELEYSSLAKKQREEVVSF